MNTTQTDTITIDGEELQMYIDNERDIYERLWIPIATALTKNANAGNYDRDAATTAFKRLIDAGARKYIREFPGTIIPASAKIDAAKIMSDIFEAEYNLGNYSYLTNGK